MKPSEAEIKRLIGEANEAKERLYQATAQFEVGKWYNPSESGYDPIKVVRRTQKYVFFENGDGNRWRMMLRTDEDGNEFVRDSTYPDRWQGAFTYNAKWEVAV